MQLVEQAGVFSGEVVPALGQQPQDDGLVRSDAQIGLPGDDRGGLRTSGQVEPGDDNGSSRARATSSWRCNSSGRASRSRMPSARASTASCATNA